MPIWRKEHELARVIVHYIGIVIFAISLSALLGKIGNRPAFVSWGDGSGPMSLPTAVCLTLAGYGFFLVSRGEAAHGDGKR